MILQQLHSRPCDYSKHLARTDHCHTLRSKLNLACSAKTLAYAGKRQRDHHSLNLAASKDRAQVTGIEFTPTVTERETSAEVRAEARTATVGDCCLF